VCDEPWLSGRVDPTDTLRISGDDHHPRHRGFSSGSAAAASAPSASSV
jgi:hypothetical protein